MNLLLRCTQFLGIRTGEHRRFLWLFTHSLFNGICVAFLFSAAYALFLHRYDVEDLPWAYIATAIISYVVVAVLARLERELPFSKLLLFQLYVVLVFIMTFWAAARLGSARWPVFLMFVSMPPLLTLLELEYWGVAVRLFDLRQGKRLFSLVATGGVLSSIAGFFLVPVMVNARLITHFEDLLLFAAVGVGLSIMAVREMGRTFHRELEIRSVESAKTPATSLSKLLKDRYFLLLSLLVTLFILTLFVVDLSFLDQVERQFPTGAALAAFLGQFYGIVKILELGVKTFLSGRLVSQFGIRFGLASLPAVLLVLIGLALAAHRFGAGVEIFFLMVVSTKLVWLVLRKAIFDGAFKVLYQPLQEAERLAFESRIEGTIGPAVTLVAGVCLLLSSRQGFDAAELLVLGLPLLVGWLVTVALLYGRYRKRLLQAVGREVGKGAIVSATEQVRTRLFEASPREFEFVAGVLARVDLNALSPALSELLRNGSAASRVAALQHIEHTLDFDAVTAVEECVEDPDLGVRQVAVKTLASLRDVVAQTSSPDRVAALLESNRPEDRVLAALALGWSAVRSPGDLVGLLWDRDPRVRRAALLAAGRLRDARFWSRIVMELSSSEFSGAASAALISIGDPVFPELESVFDKADQASDVRTRILSVYDHVGSTRARELIVDKLRFPDKEVRRRVLVSLSRQRFKPESSDIPVLKNEIEGMVKTMAWNLAAILDLGDEPATIRVSEALDGENLQNRESLFRMLALLFDSRAILMVRTQLALGNPESEVYALEILDVMVSSDLKPLIFPVIQNLLPATALRRLEAYFPRQRMGRFERLEAITYREFDEMTSWTRACALMAITELARGRVAKVLVANIFHPEMMLQEVAAGGILQLAPSRYVHTLDKLPMEQRERLNRLLDPGGSGIASWQHRSMFGRLAELRQVKVFSTLPWGAIERLATDAREVDVATGDTYPPPGEPTDGLFVLVAGRLGLEHVSGDVRVVPPGSLFGFATGMGPARVLEKGRVFRLVGDSIYEFAAVNTELMEAMLAAASPAEHIVFSQSLSLDTSMSLMPTH